MKIYVSKILPAFVVEVIVSLTHKNDLLLPLIGNYVLHLKIDKTNPFINKLTLFLKKANANILPKQRSLLLTQSN